MRQRLELLLLERGEGGPGAGGALRPPRPRGLETADRVRAQGASPRSPGQLEPRPAGHLASPALTPTGHSGLGWGLPPRAGARMTHPDEAVQFPHGHLLGTFHGL